MERGVIKTFLLCWLCLTFNLVEFLILCQNHTTLTTIYDNMQKQGFKLQAASHDRPQYYGCVRNRIRRNTSS